MSDRPEEFSARDVADRLRISRRYVSDELAAGRLRATKRPTATGRGHRYAVARADLVRWLVAAGFPLDQLRAVLNPDGDLLLVGGSADLQAALAPGRAVAVASLFELGRALSARACWAVVIDLPAVGTAEACRSLGRLAREADRPELVGLYGDDGPGRAHELFDLLLPRGIGPAATARSVLRLRPTDRASTPTPPEGP